MSYSNALNGPMPGDSDYKPPVTAPYKSPSTGGGAKPASWAPAPSGSSWNAEATTAAITSGANLVGTFADLAAGGMQKRERMSQNDLAIARLQASGAAGNAAAQLEIARLQAESARLAQTGAAKAQGKTVMMVMIGVGALAVLGIGAAVVLRK